MMGNKHRVDGPAVIYTNGTKEWYFNNKLHRTDGPAMMLYNGSKFWFLNGMRYTHEEWLKKLTPEQQYNYLWNLDE